MTSSGRYLADIRSRKAFRSVLKPTTDGKRRAGPTLRLERNRKQAPTDRSSITFVPRAQLQGCVVSSIAPLTYGDLCPGLLFRQMYCTDRSSAPIPNFLERPHPTSLVSPHPEVPPPSSTDSHAWMIVTGHRASTIDCHVNVITAAVITMGSDHSLDYINTGPNQTISWPLLSARLGHGNASNRNRKRCAKDY